MYNKNVKTIDEHNIDRDANVMFAFDLDGSGYVSYRISRDEEQDNIFISKVIKNIDDTFNMVNIDDQDEKMLLSEIVMVLIKKAVNDSADTLSGNSVTLSNNKVVKFINVSFNKEQKIDVKKTYVTTVKKEVSRVAEKYYVVEVVVEEKKMVDDIFPTITPNVAPVVEEVKVVQPEAPVAVETPILSTPAVSIPSANENTNTNDNFVTFGQNASVVEPKVETPVVSSVEQSVSPVSSVASEPVLKVETPVAAQPIPTVVEPITMPSPINTNVVSEPVVAPVIPALSNVVNSEPIVVTPSPILETPAVEPVSVATPSNDVSQPLVFNASKETNLNAALGEVANSTTIPVENIEPVREFGVDAPVAQPAQTQTVINPMVQPEAPAMPKTLTKKAGFANSKFFMVVAIAFFLASCIFLGYEVFNYFQLTK